MAPRRGKDRRVVAVARFQQFIEKPWRVFRYGESRSSIPPDFFAGDVLDSLFRTGSILEEALWSGFIYKQVQIAMRGDLMPTLLRFAHELRESARDPSQKETRALGIPLVENVE